MALAILVTIATLAISLCFLKGRQLWTNALGRFKDSVVFGKIVTKPSSEQEVESVVPPTSIAKAPIVFQQPPTSPSITNPSKIDQTQITSPSTTSIALPLPASPPSKNPPKPDLALQLKKEEILNDNPTWIPIVNTWKNISLEDQIWILQLFELRKLGVVLNSLNNDLPPSFNTGNIIDDSNICIVLSNRKKIEMDLNTIIDLDVSKKALKKCPDAIRLLPRLKNLTLSSNLLITPPDLSNNPALISLKLDYNQLTEPPDVSKNSALERIFLFHNQLTRPPDVTKNPALTSLNIANNLLTKSPDVSHNPALVCFILRGNKLTELPDISKNPELHTFHITPNPLTHQSKLRLMQLQTKIQFVDR